MPDSVDVKLPLLYSVTESVIIKNGYMALVRVSGQALIEEDDGETVILGIDPGGIWGEGGSFLEAWTQFSETLKLVLVDLATDSADPEMFCGEIKRLLAPANPTLQAEWQDAVVTVKKGNVDTHGMTLQTNYRDPGIEVDFMKPVEVNTHLQPSMMSRPKTQLAA
jgi:hypothetical protein